MRQIKHEKECFRRISKQQELSWKNKARLICIFIHWLTLNSRILSGRIQVIEIAFQNLRRAQTSEIRNQMRVRSEY